ncbi:MAG: DNA topoisomerase I [DPANN group archaeon]|nr:DNA topoisomerase I [DPANN group archaeon]
MPTQLIVSEKPAAAQKIASALGKAARKVLGKIGYFEVKVGPKEVLVVPAVGHLYTLAQKEKGYKYPVFDIEWRPTSETSKTAAFSKPYLENLKKLSKEADEFVVATDFDTEGEVIGLNIVRFAAGQKDAKRMKFSTLTAGDLKDAYASLLPHLEWGQAEAGETRHWLDWWYGINLSRAASDALNAATHSFTALSIGRVQGPALKILADRELEIQNFVSQPYWQIFANVKHPQVTEPLIATHEKDKFWEEKEATAIFTKVKDRPAIVLSTEAVKQAVNPPFPFDLTSMQIEAYRVFRIPPKKTLEIAQELYTAAYISYPRTSSQKLPPQLGYKKLLTSLAMQPEYSRLAQKILTKKDLRPNEGKKSDPAHPAIYPTGEVPAQLDAYQKKIYDLIVKRFLSVFADTGTRETTTVTFDIEKEKFVLKGTRTIEQGWQEFYQPYVRKEEVELPAFTKGKQYEEKTVIEERKTEPPKRYSQASIIKELEKKSLGTKATRAEIIDTLYRRNYVTGTSIQVTKLGLEIVKTFQKYAPEILSEELTKKFEKEMNAIRKGKLKMPTVLDAAKEVLIKICKDFQKNKKEIGEELRVALNEARRDEAFLMPCFNCKVGDIRTIRSRATGKQFAACSKYPDCKTTLPLPQGALVKRADKNCDKCPYPIIKIIRKGQRPFEMCLNPKCPSKEGWNKPQTNS